MEKYRNKIFLALCLFAVLNTVYAAKPNQIKQFQRTCVCEACDLSEVNLSGFKPAENKAFKPVTRNDKYIVKKCNLKNATAKSSNFSDTNFNANLIRHCTASQSFGCESVLGQSDFSHAVFDHSNFMNAGLAGITAENSSFQSVNLMLADLTRSNFKNAHFNGSNLSSVTAAYDAMNGFQANMIGANFASANLAKAIITAKFHGANFSKASLVGAILVTSNDGSPGPNDWNGINFTDANLTGADIGSSTMVSKSSSKIHAKALKQATFCRTIMPDGKLNNRDC